MLMILRVTSSRIVYQSWRGGMANVTQAAEVLIREIALIAHLDNELNSFTSGAEMSSVVTTVPMYM